MLRNHLAKTLFRLVAELTGTGFHLQYLLTVNDPLADDVTVHHMPGNDLPGFSAVTLP